MHEQQYIIKKNNYKLIGKCARIGDRILNRIAIIIAIAILLLGSYAIYDNFIAERSAFSQELLKYKPIDGTKSLEELNKINPDVFGWLTVKKTHIDYPVVQGMDNLEYLNQDAFRKFALAGSIFLDSKNSKKLTDKYNILYGHHMSNGAMFGDVVKFVDKKYFDKRKTGTLTLLKEKYNIEFFACVKTPASDGIIYNSEVYTNQEISRLIEHIRDRASQYRNINISDEDKIIALSTCSEAETNGRVVLFGRLTESRSNK